MAVAERDTSIKIKGEAFSLVSCPDEDSELVEQEKKTILGQVKLQDLTGNLGRAGKLIRMAYFAAKGCGYGDGLVDLKMSIYKLGIGITELTSMSSSTVSNFRESSYGVTQEVLAGYEDLLDGNTRDALDTLESLRELANEMVEEAKSLKDKFDNKKAEAIAIIEQLETVENLRGIAQKETNDSRKNLDTKLKVLREQKDKIKAKEEEARKKKEKYEEKRDKAMEEYEEPTLMQFIARKIKGKPDPFKEYKEISIEQCLIETKERESYNEKLKDELDALCELEKCSDVEGDLKTAIECMRKVTNALQHLQDVLFKAAQFWERLAKACKNLSGSRIHNAIDKVKDQDEHTQLDTWHSKYFKRNAVNFLAKWVALNLTCSEYLERLEVTEEELRSYNRENPSIEEARKQLPILFREVQEETRQLMRVNQECIAATQCKIQEIQEIQDE